MSPFLFDRTANVGVIDQWRAIMPRPTRGTRQPSGLGQQRTQGDPPKTNPAQAGFVLALRCDFSW